VVLAALNVAAPDVYVARFNLARAANAGGDAKTVLDLANLAHLSGEAAQVAVSATLAANTPQGDLSAAEFRRQRCDAAATLLTRWGPVSKTNTRLVREDSWRFWNAGQALALRSVQARSADLRRVVHQECTKES